MLHEPASGPAAKGRGSDGAVGRARRVLLHASCVDVSGTGVLLLGPSGCGKSDLALRLIDRGARLVADDRLSVERRGGRLIARAPARIAGLLEVRGLGIMRMDHCPSTTLGLVAALGGSPAPRLPDRAIYEVLGIALPCLQLDANAPSACAKIRLALAAERVE